MNLREYITTHQGDYSLPESHLPLSVDTLSDSLLDGEVTVYAVGQDAAGRSKFHLYVRDTVHIATLVEAPRVQHDEVSRGKLAQQAVHSQTGPMP
ncbi:MAG TPA: hypothetical protein VF221_09095 [Chloroflexota bacterium]